MPTHGPFRQLALDSILRQPTHPAAQITIGLAFVGLATLVRVVLGPLLSTSVPFIMFVPAVVLASLFGGGRGGLTCLVGCGILGLALFLGLGGVAPLKRYILAETVFLLSGGAVVGVIVLLRGALLDLHALRAQEELMLAELQHRVKNTLAVVQGLASQTLSANPDPAAFKDLFTARLIALAGAHNVLSERSWSDVSIRAVVHTALKPFVDDFPGRVILTGDDVDLRPDDVVSLALCLNELATNSTKYGALSTGAGTVQVGWRVHPAAGAPLITFDWREQGGPAAERPSHEGFGSRLLKRGLGRRTHAALSFGPGGARWSVEFDGAKA